MASDPYDNRIMTPRMAMSHRSVFNRLQSHDTASSAAKKVLLLHRALPFTHCTPTYTAPSIPRWLHWQRRSRHVPIHAPLALSLAQPAPHVAQRRQRHPSRPHHPTHHGHPAHGMAARHRGGSTPHVTPLHCRQHHPPPRLLTPPHGCTAFPRHAPALRNLWYQCAHRSQGRRCGR